MKPEEIDRIREKVETAFLVTGERERTKVREHLGTLDEFSDLWK